MSLLKNQFQWVAALIMIMVATTAFKIGLNAQDEFNRAQELTLAGEDSKAMIHYERSLRWYLPGLGLREKAAEGLWGIALKLEQAGKIDQALTAYRLLRSSFYSVRSLFTPGKGWIGRCNEKIAGLMASKAPNSPAETGKTREQRKKEILEELSRDRPPHTFWAVVTEAGFLCWVLCGFIFIARAFTRTGELQARPAVIWGTGFLAGYGLWILGMFNV